MLCAKVPYIRGENACEGGSGTVAYRVPQPMDLTVKVSPIWALVVAVFAVGVDVYIVVGILPEVSRDLHEPVAAVGLLASAYALPTALLAPVFGPLSDRRGRRTALLVGLGIFVASAAACVVAPNLAVLLVVRGDQRPGCRHHAAGGVRLRRRPAR